VTPEPGRPCLLAVDGVDGSGKTTLAESLARTYTERGRPVQVVHLDDFLNPRAVRYQRGRTSPEG
jgi:uridine kinase